VETSDDSVLILLLHHQVQDMGEAANHVIYSARLTA
jgi:hypothetical protein